MKRIVLIAFLLSSIVMITNAQCDKDKKFSVTSSKTEYLNASDQVQDTRNEKILFEVEKNNITVLINTDGGDNKMTGPVSSVTCDWKIPFKEGKSVIKAALTDNGGDVKNVTITIEGKDGKISFIVQLDNDPDKKIRLNVEKFE